MRILLLGADGQLGGELRQRLATSARVLAGTRTGTLADGSPALAADFARPGALAALVAAQAPDLVVNAAAHTAVDAAEQQPGLAFRVNAEAVGELAGACAAAGTPLVHFSTDYVFAGDATRPYREDDPTAPAGVYGASKLAGEVAIRAAGGPHRIFRLCWVYGPRGRNFLRTILRLAGEREVLRIVADQVGTPTPAPWIADAVATSLRVDPGASGTWHLAAGGETSWYGFAEAIVARAVATGRLARAPRLTPVTTAEYPTPARRPAYSRLDCSRFAEDFGLRLPDWRGGVDDVLAALAD